MFFEFLNELQAVIRLDTFDFERESIDEHI